MKHDIHQAITDRFVEQLRRGTVPWQKPWVSGVQNIVSRKPYRGINAFLLGMSERTSPFWLTFKQASDLGGHVRKGEKSMPVIYYKILEKRDAAGEVVLRGDGTAARIPFIRWANVFNLDQTEGITPPRLTTLESPSDPIEKAEAIVKNARVCPIHTAGFAALYSPSEDVIRMPAHTTFRSQAGYYQTLFHEMTHATGHSSRLDREGVTQPIQFGSERYSREELIAELGSAFLSNEAGILSDVQFENSTAYLSSWIEKLENDPRMIVSAASHAQRSTDFILGIEQKEMADQSQVSTREEPMVGAPSTRVMKEATPLKRGNRQDFGGPTLFEWRSIAAPERTPTACRTGCRLPQKRRCEYIRFDIFLIQ